MNDPKHRPGQPDVQREPGTREDGEALPPEAIDPAPGERGEAIPPLPEPDVEGVGNETGPSAEKVRGDRRAPGPDDV
jgi:hypothetical protein